jgi:hypothetical protein
MTPYRTFFSSPVLNSFQVFPLVPAIIGGNRRLKYFFFNKIYLRYGNTLTAVLDNTKIVPGQPISYRTLAVRGGHGTTPSGHGRYSSEKMAQKKKHCSRDGSIIHR